MHHVNALHTRNGCVQGTAGEPLAPGQLAAALQGHDMFLYFGHGSADQYLSARCDSAYLHQGAAQVCFGLAFLSAMHLQGKQFLMCLAVTIILC